nr:type VI secretion system contractile sheath large subunit [Oxalobacteraceae bacterium]
MADTKPSSSGAGASGTGSLLDQIVLNGKMANEPSQEPYAKRMLSQFASQILDEDMKFSPDKGVVTMINERIAEIDDLLTKQLNEIMHHPEFQALEGAWHGL